MNPPASPRVSVVMPAYQAAWSIGAAASSVLWQSYRDLELVVVDDGSTDRTAEIVEALEGPVRLIRQENQGVAAARNRGIESATGELIAFCDADDLWFAEHLEALLGVYERAGGIATSNCYWLFPRGIHPSRTRYKGRFPAPGRQRQAILEQNFVSTMSLFPRSLVDSIGPFDESLRRAEDWDFWLRAIYAGQRVSLQRQPLALYRWGATGLSSGWREMDADIEVIFEGLEQRVELTEDERAYVGRRRAGPGPRVLGREGDAALREGSYREAARAYAEAAQLCPAERPLVWKARVLRAAPWLTGPLVRARQLRIEDEMGIEEGHQR
ncbi:MAG TPA: glycosyltransferase [Gaiellaceae bacterium]|nr:glycosyltransferase [Gaiellaceae bacterium]